MDNVADAGDPGKSWAAGGSWMKFFPQDFLGSANVQLMTFAERGAYLTLLCLSWRLGPLSDESVSRTLRSERDALWPAIEPCWDQGADGLWRSPRLEKERQAAIERRDTAVSGARARWDARSMLEHMPEQCSDDAGSNAGGDAQHHAGSGLRAPKRRTTPSPSGPKGGFCKYCGISQEDSGRVLSLDHFVPRAAGGPDEPENLVLACHTCNQIKKGHIFETLEEARKYIHWTLWTSRRKRYERPRRLCFGGEAPTGERPERVRITASRRREPLRDCWNRTILGPDGRPVYRASEPGA